MEPEVESDFFDACRRGDLAQVEELYMNNPDLIHIENVKGFTPLVNLTLPGTRP